MEYNRIYRERIAKYIKLFLFLVNWGQVYLSTLLIIWGQVYFYILNLRPVPILIKKWTNRPVPN